ncbi:hypothetical protein ACH58_07540 [Achromobacter xylosoxidans]|uniref:hypothetical protein n=1 Tax=Alcaligenes xylosoxydans xylosoxydans TaxID=85698 RepID=UPI00064DBBB7|nr:hypothetical protein [Achromobacter xylosoxidans]KMJ92470.1 hypothetical protein ACH58_07540 [Achromobacter xylosoxidans]
MDIASAFSSLSAAIGLAQNALSARDERKIADAKQEITRVLIEVQNSCLDLQQKLFASAQAERSTEDECRALRQRVAELEKQAADRDRYEMKEIHPGTFVLRLKESAANGEPPHSLCQPCMDNVGKKAVLQAPYGWDTKLICPECKTEYQSAPGIRPTVMVF